MLAVWCLQSLSLYYICIFGSSDNGPGIYDGELPTREIYPSGGGLELSVKPVRCSDDPITMTCPSSNTRSSFSMSDFAAYFPARFVVIRAILRLALASSQHDDHWRMVG